MATKIRQPRGIPPPPAETPNPRNPRGRKKTAMSRQAMQVMPNIGRWVTNTARSFQKFVRTTEDVARDTRRAGRAFAFTFLQTVEQGGPSVALRAGFDAAITRFVTQPDYLSLAEAVKNDPEKYRACLAIGLANATLEYHIADDGEEKTGWQQHAASIADRIYISDSRSERAVHYLVGGYTGVELTGEDHPEIVVRILAVIDAASNATPFRTGFHRASALQLLSKADLARDEYIRAREAFELRYAGGLPLNISAQEVHEEISVLTRLAGLNASRDEARDLLGRASGLIGVLGTLNEKDAADQAKVLTIENMSQILPLTLDELSERFQSGKISPEAYARDVLAAYEDISKYCRCTLSHTPEIRAFIHDRLLEAEAQILERQLGGAALSEVFEDTALRQGHAVERFMRIRMQVEDTASPQGFADAMGRAMWAQATHEFESGKIELAIDRLRHIRSDYPGSVAARMLQRPAKDLWVRKYGVLTADGNFSPALGTPSRIAELKAAAKVIFDDKTSAMKGIGIGAGVALGVIAADAAFGTHVIGAGGLISGGTAVGFGAAGGLTVERARRLATNWNSISESYRLGVANATREELQKSGIAFGIEIGSLFVGGFAGRLVRGSVQKVGARFLGRWLASRGITMSDVTLSGYYTLVRESGFTAEAAVFHPAAGYSRVSVAQVVGIETGPVTHTGKDYFSSWLMLRTLGLVDKWNPGTVIASGKGKIAHAAQQLVNMSVGQTFLTPVQALLEGDFTHLGDKYLTGLFDLLAISAGQKTVGHAVGAIRKGAVRTQMLLRKAGIAISQIGVAIRGYATAVRNRLRQYRPVPGLLMTIPVQRPAAEATTAFETGVPGLGPLPLIPEDRVGESSRGKIQQWMRDCYQPLTEPRQYDAIVEVALAYRTWCNKREQVVRKTLAELEAGKINLNDIRLLRGVLKQEEIHFQKIFAAIDSDPDIISNDPRKQLAAGLKSSVVQSVNVWLGALLMAEMELEIPAEQATSPDYSNHRNMIAGLASQGEEVGYPAGMLVPYTNHETARELIWWLNGRASARSSERETFTWKCPYAETVAEIAMRSRLDAHPWPPDPANNHTLRTMLKFLGWEMTVATHDDRITITLHTQPGPKPGPETPEGSPERGGPAAGGPAGGGVFMLAANPNVVRMMKTFALWFRHLMGPKYMRGAREVLGKNTHDHLMRLLENPIIEVRAALKKCEAGRPIPREIEAVLNYYFKKPETHPLLLAEWNRLEQNKQPPKVGEVRELLVGMERGIVAADVAVGIAADGTLSTLRLPISFSADDIAKARYEREPLIRQWIDSRIFTAEFDRGMTIPAEVQPPGMKGEKAAPPEEIPNPAFVRSSEILSDLVKAVKHVVSRTRAAIAATSDPEELRRIGNDWQHLSAVYRHILWTIESKAENVAQKSWGHEARRMAASEVRARLRHSGLDDLWLEIRKKIGEINAKRVVAEAAPAIMQRAAQDVLGPNTLSSGFAPLWNGAAHLFGLARDWWKGSGPARIPQ